MDGQMQPQRHQIRRRAGLWWHRLTRAGSSIVGAPPRTVRVQLRKLAHRAGGEGRRRRAGVSAGTPPDGGRHARRGGGVWGGARKRGREKRRVADLHPDGGGRAGGGVRGGAEYRAGEDGEQRGGGLFLWKKAEWLGRRARNFVEGSVRVGQRLPLIVNRRDRNRRRCGLTGDRFGIQP
jgi:hypothetical protein